MSRYEHDRSFLSTRRDGVHSLTYIHYDGAEARMRRTPRHRHAQQLHERPNYKVHTCWEYIGELILAQPEGSRQTLSHRQSNLLHPINFIVSMYSYNRGSVSTVVCHLFVVQVPERSAVWSQALCVVSGEAPANFERLSRSDCSLDFHQQAILV